jgi:hypothetical protein
MGSQRTVDVQVPPALIVVLLIGGAALSGLLGAQIAGVAGAAVGALGIPLTALAVAYGLRATSRYVTARPRLQKAIGRGFVIVVSLFGVWFVLFSQDPGAQGIRRLALLAVSAPVVAFQSVSARLDSLSLSDWLLVAIVVLLWMGNVNLERVLREVHALRRQLRHEPLA